MMKSNQRILRTIYQKEPSKVVALPDGGTETIQIPLPEEQAKVIDRMESLIYNARMCSELSTDSVVLAATMVEYINSKLSKFQTKIADTIEKQLDAATAPVETKSEEPKVDEPKNVEDKTAKAEAPKSGNRKG